MFGGYRSLVVIFFILFVFQLYFEKMFRSRLMIGFVLIGILASALILPFADQLPLSVQRSISFLPVQIDPAVREDALESSSWRLEMWQMVLGEEVPKYFLIGKGYNFDSMDVFLTQMGMTRGIYSAYDQLLVLDDYHNGLLTLIVSFGIFGILAFAAFCWGAVRALYANYRYGDPELGRINTFLLSYFIMKLVVFLTFYGEFYLDLMTFIGIIGFSLALNGGVRRAEQSVMRAGVESKAEVLSLQPA
jgi:O-antigen ligase